MVALQARGARAFASRRRDAILNHSCVACAKVAYVSTKIGSLARYCPHNSTYWTQVLLLRNQRLTLFLQSKFVARNNHISVVNNNTLASTVR